MCFPCLSVGQQSQFQQFLVGHVVETEEVGTRLLYCIAIGFQGIGIHSVEQLSASMPQALMQVGMQVITHICIAFYQLHRISIYNKLLLHAATLSSPVVCFCKIAYGYAFASMLCPDPVGIGQVDANGCRGVFIAPEHGSTYHIGSDSLHLLLAEGGIDGRMVFKPLCIVADGFCALGSLLILVFHNALPRGFEPQRVAIHFYESVYKIYLSLGGTHPLYAIVIKVCKLSRFVISDKFFQYTVLCIVLAHIQCLGQPIHNATDGLSVEATLLPHQFVQAIFILYQARVQAKRGRMFTRYTFLCCVVALHLLLAHTIVVVAGRCLHQVFTLCLVHPFGHIFRKEDGRIQFIKQFLHRLMFCQRQSLGLHLLHGTFKILRSKSWNKFFTTVMMVDTVGKPYSFQILFQSLKSFGLAVDGTVGINRLQRFAYLQIVLAKLVKCNVSSTQGGFRQIVYQFFLFER